MPSKLLDAIEQGDQKLAMAIIEQNQELKINEGGITPFIAAVYKGYPEVVDLLIKKGEDVNQILPGNTTALFLAIDLRHLNLVNLLLKRGANPNVVNSAGITPLLSAINYAKDFYGQGFTRMIQILLKKGADPNQPDHEGRTPLDYAIAHRRLDIFNSLIKAGAHIPKDWEQPIQDLQKNYDADNHLEDPSSKKMRPN